jgi:flagellar hook-associated protein 3 FlgL
MTLRTVNPYTSYQVMLDLQRTKDQMANLTEQISSGSRLNRLSNDPTASALVLNFQDSIDQNKASVKLASSATGFLQATETTLSSVNDSIMRLLELGTQGAGSNTAAQWQAIKQEVDGIKTNVLNLANTQEAGKYLFSGTQTTTQPFIGTAAGATYAGDNQDISLDLSSSITVATNLPGDTVFFGGAADPLPPHMGTNAATDLFQQISALSDALGLGNTANIQTATNNLKAIQGQILNSITAMGGRQSMLQQFTDNTTSYNLSLQTIQNSYQDVDYPAAITDYTKEQTSQQATLSMLGKSNSLNLFNYLA